MKKSGSATKQILFAMLLGVIVGTILNKYVDSEFVQKYLLGFVFKIGSKGFIKLIKMVVVPLVLCSLVVGTSEMGNIAKLGRVGTKTLTFYLGTTFVALVVAVVVGLTVKPGLGFSMAGYSEAMANYQVKASVPFSDVLLNVIPSNPIQALASGQMLQIIFFAMLLGICLTILGDKTKGLRKIFVDFNEIMIQMVWLIMKVAPLGVFFLAADTFTKLGFSAYIPLGKYMICVFVSLFVHAILVYGGLLVGVAKLSPKQFIKNFLPVISVAFSTASSNATLPVSLKTVTDNCGVDNKVASFTIPLGATINMDGSAITQGIATMFIAQAYGVPLSITTILMIIVMATLSSIGNAGVPSASMITLAMVLNQVGLPVEAIGIIIGVDRILSMTRTMLNVSGDAICTMIIAKSEGAFDEKVFYAENKKIEHTA